MLASRFNISVDKISEKNITTIRPVYSVKSTGPDISITVQRQSSDMWYETTTSLMHTKWNTNGKASATEQRRVENHYPARFTTDFTRVHADVIAGLRECIQSTVEIAGIAHFSSKSEHHVYFVIEFVFNYSFSVETTITKRSNCSAWTNKYIRIRIYSNVSRLFRDIYLFGGAALVLEATLIV